MSFHELIETEREQRRTYIPDSAEKPFFARGFDTVTMSEIAGDAGLNTATPYVYFENKDHLLFAIVLRTMPELVGRYEECFDRDIPEREKSRRPGRTFFAFAQENADYYRMVGAVSPERFRDTDSPLPKRINELFERQLGMLRDALAEGIEDGTVRDDLHPPEMAVYLSIPSSSIVCPHPHRANVLEHAGIGHERFVSDYLLFTTNAIDRRDGSPHCSDTAQGGSSSGPP